MNELEFYEATEVLPICAVCNKPVNKVISMYDPNFFGKLFRVYCHGKVEEQMLSDMTVADSTEITFGTAFELQPTLRLSV
jgi:hypothetical protein